MLKGATTLLVLLAAGPALAAKAKPLPLKPLPPVHYVCEDGTRLIVTFSNPAVTPGTADLRVSGTGREVMLTRAAAADGGRYTADQTEFWIKGNTATYADRAPAVNCHVKK
jgi:membrane-bound inhibitor of C-type lysozyme